MISTRAVFPLGWVGPVVACLLLLAGASTSADVLHLKGGGRVVVADWWEQGGRLYYETDAGVVGIPRAEVVRIEKRDGDDAPEYRGKAEPPAPSTEKSLTPPRPRPQQQSPGPAELDTAISRLESEYRRSGSQAQSDRMAKALADLHVLRARLHYKAGEKELARAVYEKALGLVYDQLFARIELGWLELRDNNLRRAMEIVSTGLASHPNDGHLLELRAECHYRDNRLYDAIEGYQLALNARPGDQRLQTRLEKIRREGVAERNYRRADSQHFILRYDGERDERLGDLLLEVLETAWDELTRELDSYPIEPVTVIIYAEKQFRQATRTGPEVAGLYDGKIRLPMGGVTRVSPGLERVARHELVHALLHHRGQGHLPRWLHEGLAQFLEPRSHDTVGPALILTAKRGTALGIEPFSYPTALSFVTFLESRYSRTRVLWFVEELARSRREDQAFLKAFRADKEELVEEWGQWLRQQE